MKIYTKRGDGGKTSLIGEPHVDKCDIRVEAYGNVDELNAHLGFLVATLVREKNLFSKIEKFHLHIEYLRKIQNDLFLVGCELSTSSKNNKPVLIDKISEHHVKDLEIKIDSMQETLPTLRDFILPGGSLVSSQAHILRTVVRRVERIIVKLEKDNSIRTEILSYFNRLSDFFFVCSRYYNNILSIEEEKWKK